LIKAAFTLSRGMEWNRDNRIELTLTNALIVESGYEPAYNQVSQMNLPAILKIQNDIPHDSAGAIGRDGCFEMELAMRAVRARE
jgi:hypothetical protein